MWRGNILKLKLFSAHSWSSYPAISQSFPCSNCQPSQAAASEGRSVWISCLEGSESILRGDICWIWGLVVAKEGILSFASTSACKCSKRQENCPLWDSCGTVLYLWRIQQTLWYRLLCDLLLGSNLWAAGSYWKYEHPRLKYAGLSSLSLLQWSQETNTAFPFPVVAGVRYFKKLWIALDPRQIQTPLKLNKIQVHGFSFEMRV